MSLSTLSFTQFSRAITCNTDMSNRDHYPQPGRDQYSNFVDFAQKWGINTKREGAMVLAHALMETGGLQFKSEINGPRVCCQHYTGCNRGRGLHYYGRGYIQLTHDYNYRDAGQGIRRDLLNNPNSVASDEGVSWDCAFWFWVDRVRGSYGREIDNGRFENTIEAINSIEPQNKRGKREEYYRNILREFNN